MLLPVPRSLASSRTVSAQLWLNGLVALFALTILGCSPLPDDTDKIIFAPKSFHDSATIGLEGYVYASGTLTAPGLAYENNTVALSCASDRMECLMVSIDQIGPRQVGRLESPKIYRVVKWTESEIVAEEDSTLVDCRKTTISIVRKTEIVVGVEEPINQTAATCLNAKTDILKWTIEDPFWKAR
jgi:hypothetical protein